MDIDPMWHGLKIGDWATWLAGTATFLAVCAAIGVPWIQAYKQRQEKKKQQIRTAQLWAIQMTELFIRLRVHLVERRALVDQASAGMLNGRPVDFVRDAKLWGEEELPRGSDLPDLPFPVAPSLSALKVMLTMYNSSIDGVMGRTLTMLLEDAVKEAHISEMLDSAQGALARAAMHLAKYEQSYSIVDFLDKGDGTKVEPLEDYGEEV